MYTMFVCDIDQDSIICLGNQNHGTAFTLLAANPVLGVYGWSLKGHYWVEFNPLDCPAVECGDLGPFTVLGAGPNGNEDKKLVKGLNKQLKLWYDRYAGMVG